MTKQRKFGITRKDFALKRRLYAHFLIPREKVDWQWRIRRVFRCGGRLILPLMSWMRVSDSLNLLTWRDEGVKSLRRPWRSFLRDSNRTAMPRSRSSRISSTSRPHHELVSLQKNLKLITLLICSSSTMCRFRRLFSVF